MEFNLRYIFHPGKQSTHYCLELGLVLFFGASVLFLLFIVYFLENSSLINKGESQNLKKEENIISPIVRAKNVFSSSPVV